jgi:hypothetical protein
MNASMIVTCPFAKVTFKHFKVMMCEESPKTGLRVSLIAAAEQLPKRCIPSQSTVPKRLEHNSEH